MSFIFLLPYIWLTALPPNCYWPCATPLQLFVRLGRWLGARHDVTLPSGALPSLHSPKVLKIKFQQPACLPPPASPGCSSTPTFVHSSQSVVSNIYLLQLHARLVRLTLSICCCCWFVRQFVPFHFFPNDQLTLLQPQNICYYLVGSVPLCSR